MIQELKSRRKVLELSECWSDRASTDNQYFLLHGQADSYDEAIELAEKFLTDVIDQYIEAERMYKRTENSPRSHAHLDAASKSIALAKVLHLLTGVDFFEWDLLVQARQKELASK